MKVLILDFDFYTALGGGQTLYKRIVQRHPAWEFHYPSRGADMKQNVRNQLPGNVRPFVFDAQLNVDVVLHHLAPLPAEAYYAGILTQIAIALQGQRFDLVDVPSFFPVSHLLRPIFAPYGIVMTSISLGMVGWLSVGIKNAYAGEVPPEDIVMQEEIERKCVAASDFPYTISDLHAGENAGSGKSVLTIDMHDALGEVDVPAAELPGIGPPDLWYVGRIDRNKGPDLFIEMVAALPRHLYRNCYLAGPDNPWSAGLRWSDEILRLAGEMDVDAQYIGQLSNRELRDRVYRGRNIVVVPSRSDAFNYVALEALLDGCPIVLSKEAGAAGFLQRSHSEIAPPIMDPYDIPDAAQKLQHLAENYEDVAATLRKHLREKPWPKPRNGFLQAALESAIPAKPVVDHEATKRIRSTAPLFDPTAAGWRSGWPEAVDSQTSIVLVAGSDLTALAYTLTTVHNTAKPAFQTIVVDDGQADPSSLRKTLHEITLRPIKLIRIGPRGAGAALAAAFEAAEGPFIVPLAPGEGLDPDAVSAMVVKLEAQPRLAGYQAAWFDADSDGAVHGWRVPLPLSSTDLLLRRQSQPGPGAVLRKAAVEEAGGVDATLGHLVLLDLWIRLASTGDIGLDERPAGWRWIELVDSSRESVSTDAMVPILRKRLISAARTQRAAELQSRLNKPVEAAR